MLGKDYRFVFDNGSCTFRTPGGKKSIVNGNISWHKPTAAMSLMVADLLSDYLCTQLGCNIEVVHATRGFKFIFRTTPNLVVKREIPPFTVSQTQIDEISMRAGTAPSTLDTLLNPEGAEAVIWCLDTLFSKKFTYEQTPEELSWSPPPPKGNENSATRPTVHPKEMAFANLVRGFKK